MRAVGAFFKMRFLSGLQYRSAAYAGMATQLAWGFMYIMLYEALYEGNINAAPMSFEELTSYLWLQQASLALFMTWFLDNDLFNMITEGNVAYELCRPMDLYSMWFAKNCATRTSRALLRCGPILLIAFFLPTPYRFHLPDSFHAFILFIVSMLLALLIVVAYSMLIYITTFYTISPMGVRMTFVMLADFMAGSLVPIPILPEWLIKIINVTPFAAMQNTPFLIYSGHIEIQGAYQAIGVQIFWGVVLITFGYWFMQRALKKVSVQGG